MADRPPTVFISYSHDSREHSDRVLALANWLRDEGVDAMIDRDVPWPEEGWLRWMRGQIEAADRVLVICTQAYRRRFEGTEDPGKGRGATYEGAIISQGIYDADQRQSKYVPVLLGDAQYQDIPTELRRWPWFPAETPDGYECLYRLITDQPEVVRPDLGSRRALPPVQAQAPRWTDKPDLPPPPSDNHQLRLAVKLLNEVEGTSFYQTLADELAGGAAGAPVPSSPEQIVHRFSRCGPEEEEVLELLLAVRLALSEAPAVATDPPQRRRCEEAAAALYCLAAACLVARASQAAGVSYVVRVPSNELIICAVIATALFGGEIRLKPSRRGGDLPAVDYVFEVGSSGPGDQPIHDFERAAYIELFENDADAPDVSTYDGPLSEADRERLAARLYTIKRVRRASLCFIVHSDFSDDAYEAFGATHKVPVMLPDSAATRELLGMKPETLVAHIREFWAELKVMRGEAAPSRSSPPPSGGPAVPPTGRETHFRGPVYGSVSTGNHAPSQTGTGHTANVSHQQGADLAEIMALLQQLAEEVKRVAPAETHDAMTDHVELAQHEASKGGNANPGLIQRALKSIESSAKGLENSGKIVTLCNKAYNVVAPHLGLPPSPLP